VSVLKYDKTLCTKLKLNINIYNFFIGLDKLISILIMITLFQTVLYPLVLIYLIFREITSRFLIAFLYSGFITNALL